MTEQTFSPKIFEMPRQMQAAVVLLAVISVALGDVLLKKATLSGSLMGILRSPWLWGAVGLYLLQIGIFAFAFVAGWKLGIIGALQAALYTLVVLAASVLFFRESLTLAQVLGILLSLGGVVLISWP
jgi:drug/metabolite transporter (DMT)-like permease